MPAILIKQACSVKDLLYRIKQQKNDLCTCFFLRTVPTKERFLRQMRTMRKKWILASRYWNPQRKMGELTNFSEMNFNKNTNNSTLLKSIKTFIKIFKLQSKW